MDLEARLGRGYSTFMWVCFVTLVPRQEGAMMSQTFRLAVASVLLFAVCLLPDWLHAQRSFRRGDVDDSGRINLSDPVRILQNLFGNREVLGEGAVSAAFIPVFSDLREKQGLDAARAYFARFVGTTGHQL